MRSVELGRTRNAIAVAAATSAILKRRSTTSVLIRMRLRHSSTLNLPLLSLDHALPPPLRFPSLRFPCVLERVAPRLAVSLSLSSVLTGGKAITAAGGSSAAHAAVSAAIAHVAVTAVAIASGACLSTRVDFLWPKGNDLPDSLVIDGVDVTGYPIFNDAKVQKAVSFARKAHHGQQRKTGEAYVTHCIHTGKILAAMVPSSGCRAVNTVVAGILHDVIDDTFETLCTVKKEFGDDVAHLVAGVSKLSYTNQLLRRHRRNIVNQSALHPEEAKNLRGLLLGMVDDPRVVLIKLADRLHNMRTIYALSLPKAEAVAEETLAVWCSLASRLGVWALKAELEDLCFVVLQPVLFREMRAEFASTWGPRDNSRNLVKTNKSGSLEQMNQDSAVIPSHGGLLGTADEASKLKDLLQAVLPFDLLLDRKRRTMFLESLRQSNAPDDAPGVLSDAGIALGSLVACEEALEREIFISTSYIPGMEVTIYSRLKSLFSIYCKMKRKGICIKHVYDARALRVVVGDKNGTLHGPAVKNCYSLLNIVHRLWSPIDGEFDDYIINPKPSGYQSLHTAVQGPDNHPLEIQIRTQQMHEYAEFGLAAHWLYKETGNNLEHESGTWDSSTYQAKHAENERVQDDVFQKYGSLKVGHPVLRVEGSQLLSAVIVRIDSGTRELLVAVSFELEASEALTDRRYSIHSSLWEAHARLYKKVSDQWWFAPGHGDWSTCLEKYTLCRDGMYHKRDQFGRLLPTFIQVIELSDTEELEYRMVVSAVSEGKQPATLSAPSSYNVRQNVPRSTPFTLDSGINNKVHLLRTMLQWEEEVTHGVSINEMNRGLSTCNPTLNEVVIICWPRGEIMRLRSGSTAADAARRIGMEGKLVLIDGQLALPETQLRDGDILEVRL